MTGSSIPESAVTRLAKSEREFFLSRHPGPQHSPRGATQPVRRRVDALDE